MVAPTVTTSRSTRGSGQLTDIVLRSENASKSTPVGTPSAGQPHLSPFPLSQPSQESLGTGAPMAPPSQVPENPMVLESQDMPASPPPPMSSPPGGTFPLLTPEDFSATLAAHPELFASLAWPLPPLNLHGMSSQEDKAHPGAALPPLASPPPSTRRLPRGRRGPMDEMRQLVRILVKVLPQSAGMVPSGSEDAAGGNRISEDQIRGYLDRTLGAAPRPAWGVPDGWAVYLAELLSWALGRAVTPAAASRCAHRDPGRSWEVSDEALEALDARPASWPLPLALEGVRAAQAAAACREEGAREKAARASPAKRPASAAAPPRLPGEAELASWAEPELWRLACASLGALLRRRGLAGAADAAVGIEARAEAKRRLDLLWAMPPDDAVASPPSRAELLLLESASALRPETCDRPASSGGRPKRGPRSGRAAAAEPPSTRSRLSSGEAHGALLGALARGGGGDLPGALSMMPQLAGLVAGRSPRPEPRRE